MFKHILTVIWNNRRNNLSLIAGLFVISTCLWYSVDYLYTVAVNGRKTLGFDWHHVYNIQIGCLTPESVQYQDTPEHTTNGGNDMLTFLDRLEKHPAVESVCLTRYHKHYVWINTSSNLLLDTLSFGTLVRLVSPDYFRVFRVRGANGETPEQIAGRADPNEMIITDMLAKKLFPDGDATGESAMNVFNKDSMRISAVIEDQKYNEYRSYSTATYLIFNMNDMAGLRAANVPGHGVYIRVRPDADKADFMRAFRKEMRTPLRIGNLYLEDMRPMSDIRKEHLKDNRNTLYTYLTVAVFFLLNAFLAVLGTFWLRTQQRRSELALRIAFGSPRKKIRALLSWEGVLLLTIAYIPAAVVIWNLGISEILAVYPVEFAIERFTINGIITYGLLLIILLTGIWFPSRQAMKTEPADVLRNE